MGRMSLRMGASEAGSKLWQCGLVHGVGPMEVALNREVREARFFSRGP